MLTQQTSAGMTRTVAVQAEEQGTARRRGSHVTAVRVMQTDAGEAETVAQGTAGTRQHARGGGAYMHSEANTCDGWQTPNARENTGTSHRVGPASGRDTATVGTATRQEQPVGRSRQAAGAAQRAQEVRARQRALLRNTTALTAQRLSLSIFRS